MGFHNGRVFITVATATSAAAYLVYESLQRFVHQVREGGSGDFYERRTGSGVQWRLGMTMFGSGDSTERPAFQRTDVQTLPTIRGSEQL